MSSAPVSSATETPESTPLFPVVLVMLALDEHDPSVLDAVAAGAERMGAHTVVLAHVSPLDPLVGTLGVGISYDSTTVPAGLSAAQADLQGRLPGCTVVTEHGRGAPDAVLSEIVQRRDVDLLVLGRLRTSHADEGWGPSGRSLLRTVTCSALVVPQGSRLDLTSAVVGLDFSSHAAHALGVACQLADTATAVCQYDLRAAGHGSLTDAEFAAELEKNARQHFADSVAQHLPPGAAPVLEVHSGDRASEVLLDRAGTALVVVGSRGLSKLATVLLGSTAERLAGRADGPVLIVRKKGEVLSLLEGLFHR